MLIIKTKKMGIDHEFTWQIGQDKPNIHRFGQREIIEIEASGDELIHILRSFSNIPVRVHVESQKWPQPLAEFIYLNL